MNNDQEPNQNGKYFPINEMIMVLEDLTAFARDAGLNELAQALEDCNLVAHLEIANNEDHMNRGPKIVRENRVGGDNVHIFPTGEVVRRTRVRK